MYAVIVTGGKQYRVMQGEVLRVELLDVEAGANIVLDNVLMLGDGEKMWTPKMEARVLQELRLQPGESVLEVGTGSGRIWLWLKIVAAAAAEGVEYLSLFAFSTENWRRPEDEISSLMKLFARYLRKEVQDMNANGVRLKVIGDTARFSPTLQALIREAEAATANNRVITLLVCANYGGRWDMLQAARAWQKDHPGQDLDALTEAELAPYLSTGDAPEVDLLIRTGGESRVSNFLLWQAAYAEMFFSPVLWPDFDPALLHEAIRWFAGRDRRFGSSAPL